MAPAVIDAFKGDGHPLPLCGAYNEEIAIYERWEGSDVNPRPAPRCGSGHGRTTFENGSDGVFPVFRQATNNRQYILIQVLFAVRWISHSSARLWTVCCLRVLASFVVGRRNVESQRFDQVSSHARINVLTVSGLSSAKIRALGELYDNHEIIALLSGQGVKLDREAFHGWHDTCYPVQASYPRPVAPCRNAERQPSS